MPFCICELQGVQAVFHVSDILIRPLANFPQYMDRTFVISSFVAKQFNDLIVQKLNFCRFLQQLLVQVQPTEGVSSDDI